MQSNDNAETIHDINYFLSEERFFPSSVMEDRRFNKLMEPFGTSYSNYLILKFLLKYPNGIEPSKIADEFCILRQTMTNIVDSMQADGYVERIPHPNDRRRIYVRLLPYGIEYTRRLSEVTKKFHNAVRSKFTDEELLFYFNIRNKLTQCMDELLEIQLGK